MTSFFEGTRENILHIFQGLEPAGPLNAESLKITEHLSLLCITNKVDIELKSVIKSS